MSPRRPSVFNKQRLVVDERKKLLRACWCAERPEAGSYAAGENDSPSSHSSSATPRLRRR